ncbi:MAG: hypothetical protein U9R25_01495 [Chloroflexota bacterium]|nr:hypothetical protein [Chloroflexota bacterium]
MREASFWNDFISKSMTLYANLIFVVLWVGLVVALIMNHEWLDEIWIWTQALPTVPKIIVWVLFLPIMVALWIWESSWPAVGRLLGFAGIVAWTFLAVNSIFKHFR